MQDLGKDFDIPKLAQEFGQKLATAINAVGVAFEFTVKHAHELKLALEALAGLQLAKIAIPLIAELANGGLAKAGAGIAQLFIGFAGLGRVLPALAQFASFLKTAVWMVGSLAAEEGIASAAGYGLAAAVAAVGGPVTIAIAAVAGIILLLYKFRDATFSLGGTTYQLRDIWNAAWIVMGNVFTWVGDTFHKVVDFMKGVWDGFMKLLTDNIIVQIFKTAFTAVLEFAQKILGALVPQFVIDALNQAKAARLAPAKKPAEVGGPAAPELPAPDTEGLGAPKKEKKDLYGEEVRKLVELVQAQKAYIAVLDESPEKINAVAAAEKSNAVILALNTKLLDEKRPALTEAEKATIRYLVATEESLKVDHEYGKELVAQQHAADLATHQALDLAKANLEGVDAVRAATVANTILGLTYNRTAEELKMMAPELAKLNALLTQKQTTDVVESTNKEIFALRQEVAMRQISVNAAGQYVDAQRSAALAVKLYTLNQQLATEKDHDAIAALEKKRDLIIELTKAEWAEEDAKASTALRSPVEQYQEEVNQLSREVTAMQKAQGGNLTYAQSLQVAAKAQDAFNKTTDETVALLLRFGGLKDGVTAFFLDMQKQAKSSASIIYEALNSTFNKLADNLTELLTGGKADFGKMFKDIGKQMLNSTLKSGMQQGLGALGSKMGIDLGGALKGKPDGTKGNPLWVKMAKDAGLNLGGAASDSSGSGDTGSADASGASGLFGGLLSKASGFFGPLLKGLLGGGGLGGFGALAGAFAGGGDMEVGKSYLVGENGPEIKRGNRISSNSASQRMLGGQASNHYYTIDARGTDPVLTEQRTRAAIMAAHNSAVGKSVQVQAEQVKRMPQR